MRHRALLLLLIFTAAMALPGAQRGQRDWPPITAETKPWTRWWWQGSAVERRVAHGAARGARGGRDRRRRGDADLRRARRGRCASSPTCRRSGWRCWITRCARRRRLKMGVDMATGTGWPFGGPVGRRRHRGEIDRCQDLDARRRRTSGRAGQAAPDAARPRHRQSDSRRQRRRARRPAAALRHRAGHQARGAGHPDQRSRRAAHGQPESAGAGARAGEVSRAICRSPC